MKKLCSLLIVSALVLAGSVEGQDKKAAPDATYTIKLRPFGDVGKSVTGAKTDKKSSTSKVYDKAGKMLGEEKSEESSEVVMTEVVLEKGDKSPKKFKRTYEKASETAKGKTEAQPYQGKTIIFEMKDGTYQATVEKGEVPAAVLKKLASEASKSSDGDIVPNKPVKVGESWTLGKKFFEGFSDPNMEIDAAKSKATAKLVKAYKKDGKQFGVIDADVSMVMNFKGVKADPMIVDLKISLDAAIDGSTTAGVSTMSGKFKGAIPTPDGGKVDIAMEMTGKDVHSAEK